jgi:hypothetical protein
MSKMNLNRAPVTIEQSDKLMKARCRLMTREPWYGHIAMSMVWIPSNMPWLPEFRRTMGVRIVNGGEIQCLYYPPFVESLSIRELFAVVQHEIEHIVRVHCIRVGGREPHAWNIAVDMAVNGTKSHPRIGYHEANTNEIIVPLKGNIVWIPEDWPKDGTSEQFYDMLEKKQQQLGKCCPNCRRPQNGQQGKGRGQKGKKQDPNGQGSGSGGQDSDPRVERVETVSVQLVVSRMMVRIALVAFMVSLSMTILFGINRTYQRMKLGKL